MEIKRSTDDDNLQFDISRFKRRALNAETLTRQQKEALTTKPEARTEEQISGICRALQWLDEFTYYPTNVQKEFAHEAFYECYGPTRIIFKEGNYSDFLYFVLKGTLILRGGQDGTTIVSKDLVFYIIFSFIVTLFQ